MKVTHRKIFLALWGLIFGAAVFIAVYGVRILDVTHDEWIFRQHDPDIKQHYLGWCMYRSRPWYFPIGLTDGLSYPYKMSVLWTDSMPLFAMFFKAFRAFLPPTFQYIGLYGLISMALTGAVCALLLERLTDSLILSAVGCALYVIDFPLFQRMFYHTTLTAHYLILLALLFWLSDIYKLKLWKKSALWGLLALLCVTIHPYIWAMCALIALFALIDEYLHTKELLPVLFQLSLSAALTAFGLWMEGAFYGNVNASYQIGGFESNLNSLFNSLNYSRLFPELPLAYPTQYEGFGYLGTGGLLIVVIAAAAFVYRIIKAGEDFRQNLKKLDTVRLVLLWIMLFSFLIICSMPNFSFGEAMVHIPLRRRLSELAGIFRSNGRFVWPVMFTLLSLSVYMISQSFGRAAGAAVFLICAALQIYDVSEYAARQHERFSLDYEEDFCHLDTPELTDNIDRYSHIVMTYGNLLSEIDFAHFAMRYNLTMNRFYFARDIDGPVNEKIDSYINDLADGRAESDVIYIFSEEQLEEWTADKRFPLHFYELHGTIIGVSEPLEGLEEFLPLRTMPLE